MKQKLETTDVHNDALSRQSLGLAAIMLGLAIIVVFGDLMIAGNSKLVSKAGTDVYLAELGRCEFNFGQLSHGNFPLWCPELFCGYPSFGGMQSGLVYPLSVPFLFLSAVEGINWSFILHTFLGGMLMYVWLGRQSLHRYACLAGALMFAFAAPFYLRAYAGHLTPNNTIAWIPLVFLAIEGIIATPSLGWFLLGTGAVTMELLAGYPQILFYTGIAAALYTLARIHESPKVWKSLGLLAAMNVFVLALTCVQWAAGTAMASECVRKGGVPYQFAASYSLPWENWLTLLGPGIFGNDEKVLYWGRWNFWEMCLYFGVIGVFFSALGLFHARRRLMLSVAGIVLVLGVLAMGANMPHFRFFFDHVPGFNIFRSNSKFAILVVTFLIFLSAHGLDMLFRDHRKRVLTGMFFGSLGFCAAVGLMFCAVYFCSAAQFKAVVDSLLNSGQASVAAKYFASPGAIAAAAELTAGELATAFWFLAALTVVLGFVWRRSQWQQLLAPIVIGMIALDLLRFAVSMHVSFPPDMARGPLLKPAVIRQQMADGKVASQPIPDLLAFMKKNLGDGRTFSPDGSNIAMFIDGDSDLWGYGSDCVVRRYAEFIAFTQGANPNEVTGYQIFRNIPRRFDMLRCKCALLTQADGSMVVFATPNLAPLPRFLLVDDWRVEPHRDVVFDTICTDKFDPRKKVILERRPIGWTAPEKTVSTDAGGTISILRESTDWQEVEVTLRKPAVLLETDLYTPNWHVYSLPGSSQSEYELIPANYILRGIPLAAGLHRLRIEYRPTAFVVGKWVSLVSLASFIALAAFWGIRRRRMATERPAPQR